MKGLVNIYFSLVVLSVLMSACGTKKHPYFNKEAANWQDNQLPQNTKAVHTLYLIGDAGKMDRYADTSNYVVESMAEMMDMNDKNTTVVFLGDNIYPIGLVSKQNKEERKKGEKIVYAQLQPLSNFQGETYIIPGNHDWNDDQERGLEAVKRQEEYIESNFGNSGRVHFYPNMGCGDPEVVRMNEEVVYIFIDSQWWLQNWNKENKINEGCEIRSREDFLNKMEALFLEYKDEEIICMLHHPIKSNGNHGGYFSFRQHIFPLAELGVWLPLPVIGSIYPLYRKVKGSTQDNTNNKNQNLTKGLENMAEKHDLNIVFASGHEHGLEYFENSKIKYIVSGSGAKTSYIQKGGEAVYAREARGFARILFYENSESWLEFYAVNGYEEEPKLEFRTALRKTP